MKQTYAVTIKKEITTTLFLFTESEQEALEEAHDFSSNNELEHLPDDEAERNTFISIEEC